MVSTGLLELALNVPVLPAITPVAVMLPVSVRLPVMAWLPTNVLAVLSSGTVLGFTLRVMPPLVPPPVNPVPAVTPVIVPVPFAVAQAQALPLHANAWPLAQVLSRPRFSDPLMPPPTCASGQVLEWNGSAWACATAKGTGTITGVTAGTGLTGGGTSGGITLKVNPSTVPLLNTANTFVGNQAITGNLTDTGNITATGAIAGKTGTFSANSSNPVETITQSGAGVGLVVNAGGATYGTQSTAALLGVYAKATAAGGDGVSGNSTRGVGVYGYDNATSGTSVGVTGQSTSSGGYGVVGTSPNDGVYGDVAGPSTTGGNSILFYAGVWGDTGGCGGCDYYGVTGTADNNIAGLFVNTSNDFTTLYIQNNGSGGKGTVLETHGNAGTCTIDTGGSVGCTGKVGADASVDGGARKVSLYAVQSPENWFEDFGSGTLASGAVTIALDATFAQTINTITGYHVFLTPNGDCKGLYISQKSAASFQVRELGGGSSSVAFDYRIVARRSGYENVRLTDVTEKYQRTEKQEQQRQQRMAQRRAARAAAGPIAAAVVAPHK